MNDTRFKPGNKFGVKFKLGNPGKPKTYTPELLRPYLLAARGIKTRTLKLMHEDDYTISQMTLDRTIHENPDLKQFIAEVRAAALENLVEQEFERADRGDQKSAQFLLAKLHPDFKNKTEITGEGGGPLMLAMPKTKNPIEMELEGFDSERLTRDERVEFSMLADLAGRAGTMSVLRGEQWDRFAYLLDKGKTPLLEAPVPMKDVTPPA